MTSRFLVAVAAVAAAAGLALADPDYKAAAEHYKTAEQAMAAGDFPKAALEYGVAYDITKDPVLFYKIGQANQKAGKCPVALTYYNRYLKEGNPSPEYRQLTVGHIAACDGTGAPEVVTPGVDRPAGDAGDGAGTAAADPLPTVTDGPSVGTGDAPADGVTAPAGDDLGGDRGPTFVDAPPSWQRTGAWVATGVTVGLAAAGVVMALSAEGSEEDLQSLIEFRSGGRPLRYDEVASQYASLDADGRKFDKLATAAFIGAGVTAAIATTLFLLDRGTPHGEPAAVARLRPTLDRHGAGVAVGWKF
ncbi:MAG: hypothetical protein R3B06_05435 [Kofleriaceae bacterium]